MGRCFARLCRVARSCMTPARFPVARQQPTDVSDPTAVGIDIELKCVHPRDERRRPQWSRDY